MSLLIFILLIYDLYIIQIVYGHSTNNFRLDIRWIAVVTLRHPQRGGTYRTELSSYLIDYQYKICMKNQNITLLVMET